MFEEEIPELPWYVRFETLRERNIVKNWQQLRRMRDEEDFPAGRLLSPNVRVWTVEEIKNWLASRPIDRKIVPRRKKQAEQQPDDEQLEDVA